MGDNPPWDFSHWSDPEEGRLRRLQNRRNSSVSALTRRSGCFPTEPYPPARSSIIVAAATRSGNRFTGLRTFGSALLPSRFELAVTFREYLLLQPLKFGLRRDIANGAVQTYFVVQPPNQTPMLPSSRFCIGGIRGSSDLSSLNVRWFGMDEPYFVVV